MSPNALFNSYPEAVRSAIGIHSQELLLAKSLQEQLDTGTLVKHGPLDVVYAYLHIFRWILAPTLLPIYRNFRYFHP